MHASERLVGNTRVATNRHACNWVMHLAMAATSTAISEVATAITRCLYPKINSFGTIPIGLICVLLVLYHHFSCEQVPHFIGTRGLRAQNVSRVEIDMLVRKIV